MLEEHDRGPVVRLVLVERARCAGGQRGGIVGRVHSDVEGVTSDNLVKMGSVLHARVDERIRSLNDQL